MDLGLWFPCVDFQVGSIFDLKQWVGSDSHLVYFERGAISLESDLLLCLDNFMVTFPYNQATTLYSLQLSLRQNAAPSYAAGGLDFLLKSLSCSSNGHFLSIQRSETIPRGWFQIRIGYILPWVILDRLITTVIDVVLTLMFFSTPRGNHAIVGWCLWWHFGHFSITLWSAKPTADICLCSFGMGPLARLITGRAILFLCWGLMMNLISEHQTVGCQ